VRETIGLLLTKSVRKTRFNLSKLKKDTKLDYNLHHHHFGKREKKKPNKHVLFYITKVYITKFLVLH